MTVNTMNEKCVSTVYFCANEQELKMLCAPIYGAQSIIGTQKNKEFSKCHDSEKSNANEAHTG